MNLKTIALMIRNPDRLDLCRLVTDQFGQGGSKIQVFALGLDGPCLVQDGACWQNCSPAHDLELFTDTSGPMETYGFKFVDSTRIAALIDQADVVIPL